MKLFERFSIEDFIVAFVTALAATIFASGCSRVWTWWRRSSINNRKQFRFMNYVEIWRRIKNPEYLLLKEHELLGGLPYMAAFSVLAIGLMNLEAEGPISTVFFSLLLIIFVFFLIMMVGYANVEWQRNMAARALRAGLKGKALRRELARSTTKRNSQRRGRPWSGF